MKNKTKIMRIIIITIFCISLITSIFCGVRYGKLNAELLTTQKELNTTQENLKLEIKESEGLKKSLNNMSDELEEANITIADLTSEEYELVYMGDFRFTYYCNEPYEHICGFGQRMTASGKPTEVGWTAAADTSVLPMGSIIYVEGFGFREVMDVGGGVKGNHVDILVDTHEQALSMGRSNGGVWVLVKK